MPSYNLPTSQVLRIMEGENYTAHNRADDLLYDTLQNLSNEIRKYRREHGITNKELAKMCGITTSVMSRLESGYQNVALKTVCKVISVMNKEFTINKRG